MNLKAKRIMKDNSIRKPQPKPISKEVAGTFCLTQLTMTTGAVWRVEATATLAPVSLTLLVKTIIAPDSMEYFVNGKMIVLNTPSGLAPSVLEASSRSTPILSMAAEGETTIRDAECVSKSYPSFWMDFERVGVKMRRIEG